MTAPDPVDRPAAIRRALRDLVAARGFHGASMSAVAERAGVATGTAYVHYESKEDLVHATYVEIKTGLGAAAASAADAGAPPRERYRRMMFAAAEYLLAEPERARFLTQMEESPFHSRATELLREQGDRLLEEATKPDIAAVLVPLPPQVIYALSFGALVRLAAAGTHLALPELDTLIDATWRAITRPGWGDPEGRP